MKQEKSQTQNSPIELGQQIKTPQVLTVAKWILLLAYIAYTFQNISVVLPQIKPYYILFTLFIVLSICKILLSTKIEPVISSVKFHWIFIFFTAWNIASMAWSIEPALSLQQATKFSIFCLLSICITSYFINDIKNCIYIIAIALSINFIITTIGFMYIFIAKHGYEIIASGNIGGYIDFMSQVTFGFTGGKNLLSSWAGFQLTLTVPLLRYYYNKKTLSNIIAASAIAILAITISRIAIYSIALFAIILLFRLDYKIKLKIFWAASLAAVLFITCIQLSNSKLLSRYYKRVASPINAVIEQDGNLLHSNEIKETGDRGVYGRLILWQIAIKSLQTHSIWLGTGSGTVYAKGIDHEDSYHNQALQSLAQLGLPGFILFIAWNIKLLISQITIYKRSSKQHKFLAWLLAANLIIYTFKGMFMSQYLDLEIWTIIILTALLYTGIERGNENG